MATPPGTGDYRPASGTVALAVCIARTLHLRDGKFLEALRTELAEMLQEAEPGSEPARFLYALSVALDDRKNFPPLSGA